MAAVYSLRLFIKTMHNRVGADVESRDISFREGLVLVPLVAVILFFALYPQLALHKERGRSTARSAPPGDLGLRQGPRHPSRDHGDSVVHASRNRR